MKNKEKKIANLILSINAETSETKKNVINKYWGINDKFQFVHSYKSIQSFYDLTRSEISAIRDLNSCISFYGYCTKCKSYEYQKVKNRIDFKNKISIIRNRNNSFVCNYCIETKRTLKEKQRQLQIQHEKEYQKIVQLKAIENKLWLQLSSFHQVVLKDCVDFDNIKSLKRYYSEQLGDEVYTKLFDAMYDLGEKKLLELTFEDIYGSNVLDYTFHQNLKGKLDE